MLSTKPPATAFIAATGDGNYLLTPKPDAIADAPQGPAARQRQLDVVQLHRIVLDKLLGLDRRRSRAWATCSTSARPTRRSHLVACGEANIAFLIKPITLDQLRDVSLAGE